MARVYKSPVFCNLLEKGSLYQFWKNNLIYWKKRSTFYNDFVIFPLKFALSGEYWSSGQVKWLGLTNVLVIRGSSYGVIFMRKYWWRFNGNSKTVQVTRSSSYWGFELLGVYCILYSTVYYTVTNLYLQLHIPNKSWAKFLKTLLCWQSKHFM